LDVTFREVHPDSHWLQLTNFSVAADCFESAQRETSESSIRMKHYQAAMDNQYAAKMLLTEHLL